MLETKPMLCPFAGAPTWNTGADTERSGTAWDNLLEDIKGAPLWLLIQTLRHGQLLINSLK